MNLFYTENDISEIEFNVNRYTKVDSNWITDYMGKRDDTEWMQAYWGGVEYPWCQPNWELLIDGSGVVLDMEIREKAHDFITEYMSGTIPLIRMAMVVFYVKREKYSQIAKVCPFLCLKNDVLHGQYYIKMQELHDNQEEIGRLILEYNDGHLFFNLPEDGDIFPDS